MKTIHVVMAMAAWLGVSGMVRASSAEVGYRRAETLVALAEGQPADFLSVGEHWARGPRHGIGTWGPVLRSAGAAALFIFNRSPAGPLTAVALLALLVLLDALFGVGVP